MLTQLRNHFRAPYNFRYLWTYAGAVILPDMLGRLILRLLKDLLEIPFAVAVVVTSIGVIEGLSWMLRRMGFIPFNALVVSTGTLCIGLPSWPGMQPELGGGPMGVFSCLGLGVSLPIFMREMHEFSKRNPNY